MIQLVIFDLDGTLVNTIPDLADSVNFSLNRNGFPTHGYTDYPGFVGNGIYKLIERALPADHRDTDTILSVKEVFVKYYMKHCVDKSAVYQGVDNLLHQLCDKGVKVAVASNKVHVATLHMMKVIFPDIPFACVLGQRNGVPTKPDPAIVFEILRTTNVNPNEVLYVGDSGVDMQTAHNAGLAAVGVSWGLRPVSELQQFEADYIIDEPSELLRLLTLEVL